MLKNPQNQDQKKKKEHSIYNFKKWTWAVQEKILK